MKKLSYTSTISDTKINGPSTADELEIPRDTPEEEVINSFTHGVAAVASVFALWLILNKIDIADPKYIISAMLYGGSMIILFTCSTLLHIHTDDAYTKTFVILDHSAIYWLIAGTYTPMALLKIANQGGTELFIAIWIVAILGTIFKLIVADKYQWISVALYVGTGWVGILLLPEMMSAVGDGIYWIIAGGLFYTLGVPFYLWRSLRYNHAIWHLFVMAGAGCIFYGFYYYVF
ncbi:PAQR family membrane homeostasis protein TrhA [Flammeovirga kamogawensis]|uniref:Hemolysin III family protein n=1 Tax=Flammeovirga kamogawensis TaxID=373891 RepID=A0ABX8GUA7_9BACT|nr:hemolysin III family protein [Flammeovirga kamogawensis]MBB6459762.1 hemolysin III [Flammeovirga kamogawensis]QWG07179.1 hemolysin III family protein [Flammeovirga kamogawensis]TRX69000.1 hypothetical protein EO216_13025 [Flammeovirga kamogawensis]